MKRPLIRGKDFHNLHWTRRTSSRRVHGKLGKRGVFILFVFEVEWRMNV
jgi:hypothetical protein